MYFELKPVLKEYIWAGTKLKNKYNKVTDLDKVSESWEYSVLEGNESIVVEKNLALSKFINDKSLMLIKLIDAEKDLSIQVHPSDEYAKEHYNKLGKTECWYIVDNEPNSYIYLGFNKDYSKEEVTNALNNGTITNLLNKVYVNKDDFFVIPSGTIHAICSGITLYEIQESSDLTFRLYDYDRVDKDGNKRQLHINESLDVLNYKKYPVEVFKTKEELVDSKYFKLNRILLDGNKEYINNSNAFEVLTVLGDFSFDNKMIKNGTTYIVEANTKININGKGTILVAR